MIGSRASLAYKHVLKIRQYYSNVLKSSNLFIQIITMENNIIDTTPLRFCFRIKSARVSTAPANSGIGLIRKNTIDDARLHSANQRNLFTDFADLLQKQQTIQKQKDSRNLFFSNLGRNHLKRMLSFDQLRQSIKPKYQSVRNIQTADAKRRPVITLAPQVGLQRPLTAGGALMRSQSHKQLIRPRSSRNEPTPLLLSRQNSHAISMKHLFDRIEKRVSKEEAQCDCNSERKVCNKLTQLKRLLSAKSSLKSDLDSRMKTVLQPIKQIDYGKLIKAMEDTKGFYQKYELTKSKTKESTYLSRQQTNQVQRNYFTTYDQQIKRQPIINVPRKGSDFMFNLQIPGAVVIEESSFSAKPSFLITPRMEAKRGFDSSRNQQSSKHLQYFSRQTD